MTEQQRALLLLIKSALTGEANALPNNTDLANVFQVAKRHGVDVMAYYGALLCGIDKNAEPLRAASMRVYQSIAVSETQLAAIRKITDACEARGVLHMPLKGTLLKGLYPHAEMRRMGDADILIDCSQYDIIRSIMDELGYIENYESDHELVWSKNPVCIEFHKRLIPSYNKDYYQYYGDGWKLAALMDGYSFRYKMNPCDEMVYLFTHFAKHYRDAGIGLRHIIDLWVYHKHNPNLDEAYIATELKKLQLFEFYDNIMRTLRVWFENYPDDDKTELITQFVFTSGEYGHAYNANLSNVLKNNKKGQSAQAAKCHRVFKALFPDFTEMRKIYPVLKKLPGLLPIMWVVRLIYKAFHAGDIRNFIRRRLSFKAEEVSAYQQSLNHVGLDFNFQE